MVFFFMRKSDIKKYKEKCFVSDHVILTKVTGQIHAFQKILTPIDDKCPKPF